MDRSLLTPAERLIVAADFSPGLNQGRVWVEEQILNLASALEKTRVIIKVNSALRAVGYDLILYIHNHGLQVFADLKLNDIPQTMVTDGQFLREVKPEMLTVMCSTGVRGMVDIKKALPGTEILGVTVLTSLTEAEVKEIYGRSIDCATVILTSLAADACIGGIICSPKEANSLRGFVGPEMTINTPGIRPAWTVVAGDDQNQNRVMTPADAIKAGADRIVVGRPIVTAKKPYDAAMRTIDEIAVALDEIKVK